MYTENLSTLVSFIRENSHHKFVYDFLYDNDDLFWIRNNIDCINEIISVACNLNKRLHSDNVSEAIEEVADIWEVSR